MYTVPNEQAPDTVRNNNCTVLWYCTVLYCVMLYCTVLQRSCSTTTFFQKRKPFSCALLLAGYPDGWFHAIRVVFPSLGEGCHCQSPSRCRYCSDFSSPKIIFQSSARVFIIHHTAPPALQVQYCTQCCLPDYYCSADSVYFTQSSLDATHHRRHAPS